MNIKVFVFVMLQKQFKNSVLKCLIFKVKLKVSFLPFAVCLNVMLNLSNLSIISGAEGM